MPQQSVISDQDRVFTILAELKRTAREYATAVTESNCPTVRQTFENLLQDTLNIQEQVYQIMSNEGWYSAPSQALSQNISNQVTEYQQKQQQTSQLVEQNIGMTQGV